MLSKVYKRETLFPSICFPICFRVGLEAQFWGKDAAELCEPQRSFYSTYNVCVGCLIGNQQNNSSDILPQYAQFLEFCSSQVASSSTATTPTIFPSSAPPATLTFTSPAATTTPAAPSSVASGAATSSPAPVSTSSPLATSAPPPPASSSAALSTFSSTALSTFSSTALSTPTSVSVSTSFITKSVTQAGSTATYTEPGATVYQGFSVTTKTVTSSVTSLTVCPSLTINPTYTVAEILPLDYAWGCRQVRDVGPQKSAATMNYFLRTHTTAHRKNPADFGLKISQVFGVEAIVTSTKTTNIRTASAPSIASHTTTAAAGTSQTSAGVIAEATVGAVAGAAVLIALLSFFLMRRLRRRKQAAEAAAPAPDEKAQLHSDDAKPVRTELPAGIKRKPVPPREMPANEDPRRTVSEMPANEVVGSEMESTLGRSKGTSNTAVTSNP